MTDGLGGNGEEKAKFMATYTGVPYTVRGGGRREVMLGRREMRRWRVTRMKERKYPKKRCWWREGLG